MTNSQFASQSEKTSVKHLTPRRRTLRDKAFEGIMTVVIMLVGARIVKYFRKK